MTQTGIVSLVGAGPGDAELITLKGLRILRSADIVLYDRLASPDLLPEARSDAELIDVGKRAGTPSMSQEAIHRLIIEKARRGLNVVRLKGGDPLVFGRGGEEREACRRAGIRCRVIPGVSSALAAPAAVGIPLTHRHVSGSFAVVTASRQDQDNHRDKNTYQVPNFAAWAAMDTLVILMGRRKLAIICRGLIKAGRAPETPAACIESATTTRQRSAVGRLDSLAELADRLELSTPAVIVVGETVSLATSAAYLSAVGAAAPAKQEDDIDQTWPSRESTASS